MERKQIKQRQKEIRRQIQDLIDLTPNWSSLPDDAPEIRYARELQKEIERLGKLPIEESRTAPPTTLKALEDKFDYKLAHAAHDEYVVSGYQSRPIEELWKECEL